MITEWLIQQQSWAIPCMYVLVCIACIKYILIDW